MNLILLQNWFPITIISNKLEEKEEYYNTLQKAQVEWNKQDFLLFIAKNVEKSLNNYLEFLIYNKKLWKELKY